MVAFPTVNRVVKVRVFPEPPKMDKQTIRDILNCVKIDDLKVNEESLEIFRDRFLCLLEPLLE